MFAIQIPTKFGFPKTNLLNDPVVDQNEQFQVDAFTISEIDEEHASFFGLKSILKHFKLTS